MASPSPTRNNNHDSEIKSAVARRASAANVHPVDRSPSPGSPVTSPSQSPATNRATMTMKGTLERSVSTNDVAVKRSPVAVRSLPRQTSMNSPNRSMILPSGVTSPGIVPKPGPLRGVATPSSTRRTMILPRAGPPPPVPNDDKFPLRVRLSTGENLMIRCAQGHTAKQFLDESISKLHEFIDPSIRREELSLATEQGVSLTSDEVISQHPYIVKCRTDGTYPILTLSSKQQPVSSVTSPAALQRSATVSQNATTNGSRMPSEPVYVPPQTRLSMMASASSETKQFLVQFLLPGGQTVVLTCHQDAKISEVKEQLLQVGHKMQTLHSMDHYILKTPSAEGYLSDETITLGCIPFIENCREDSTTPKLILQKKSAISKREKIINLEIGSLIGSPLIWTQEDKEISQFRKSMQWVRWNEKQNVQEISTLSPDRTLMRVPSNPGQKVLVKLRLPLIESSTVVKTVAVPENETATGFLHRMYNKYYRSTHPTKTHQDFVMKVAGFAEYIDGEQEFHTFALVQEALSKGKEVQLNMVERENDDSELYNEEFPDEELLEDPKYHYDHEDIKYEVLPWDQMNMISFWELNKSFRLRVIGVENLKMEVDKSVDMQLYLTAGLYHGGELVAPSMTTSLIFLSQNPRWYEWLTTNIVMSNIPRGTRLCFTVFARPTFRKDDFSNKDTPLGWVACQLFDYKHELRTGLISLHLWPNDIANPIGTCVGCASPSAATLFIELDTYALPVVFPTEDVKEAAVDSRKPSSTMSLKASKVMGMHGENLQRLDTIIMKDPLFQIEAEDKRLLWEEREYCKSKPKALPKFLTSVAYNDRLAVQIMHSMLDDWAQIGALDALELLDSRFGDERVRSYAVKALETLSDDELNDYLLQLIQVLKYEPYHDSALARFLLRRALKSRRIGHSFFWYLKSEIHVPEISERFGLLLESYLRGCGTHRAELQKQTAILKDFTRVANFIKNIGPSERRDVMIAELKKVAFPTKLQLPLNPSIEVNGLVYEKCKYMDSKKIPLWLVFQNSDPMSPPKYVIYKSGDDLRQDMLTLQMIRLMDKFWKSEGLDLELSPYGCIATGDEQGMIEVVLNSDTCANITKNAGGATAAFRADPLANWLRTHNPRDEQYQAAVEKFVKSCAGYCVATYVLGIGDRHNDNVMMTKDGKLFHIDFGHFLGNYKKKFGIKRERAPFVFTPDFAHVMGGRDSKDFMKFIDTCCRAYNIVRKHSNLFINLFAMMLSTGIPELQSVEDLWYLRDAFSLDYTDEKAREKFTTLIYESLATKTTQLNNAIHI
eukprot:TRINITY_DN5165_c0_g1_i1.p1 TRINITY_DN5165_c0_g1~~TRINITY_DN5165_c0_g1_i1.p1  ORF type:complete len:1287 (-),score=389.49 TRINITY_DN5165_c0_g1_i1:1418-5278(-)